MLSGPSRSTADSCGLVPSPDAQRWFDRLQERTRAAQTEAATHLDCLLPVMLHEELGEIDAKNLASALALRKILEHKSARDPRGIR